MRLRSIRVKMFATVRPVIGSLVLGIYMVASLPENSIHDLVHTDELIELHSLKNEANPCHQRLYHANSISACDHDSHISEFHGCPLSHIIPVESHLSSFSLEIFNGSPALHVLSIAEVIDHKQPLDKPASRAPPSC